MTEDLLGYPRPNVAVDLALLSAVVDPQAGPGQLVVLLQEHTETGQGLALPGRFLRDGQTVVEGMSDVLRVKVGIDIVPTRPLLLDVYDEPGRDPRAWTISLAHALALPHAELAAVSGRLVRVDLNGRAATRQRLLFDHAAMVAQAALALRGRYERRPDPDHLLDEPFTLNELRLVHEAVLGELLKRDTFDRRMREHLEPTLEDRQSGGRPAKLYRRRTRGLLSESELRRVRLPRKST